jgi:RNA polymerase primary sigma factor
MQTKVGESDGDTEFGDFIEDKEAGNPMELTAMHLLRDKLRDVLDTLNPREREVLELLAAGAMYKEVAKKLDNSINTVLTYVRRIYKKLHVNSRHAAVDRFKKMR